MNFFRNITIGRRILFGLSLPLVVLIIQGIFTINALQKVNATVDSVNKVHLPKAVLLGRIDTNIADLTSDQLRHTIAPGASEQAELESTIQGIVANVNRDKAEYKPLITNPAALPIYQSFDNQWNEYTALQSTILQLSKAHKAKELAPLLVSSDELFDGMTTQIEKLINLNQDNASVAVGQSNDSLSVARKVIYLGVLTALLFSVLTGWYMKVGANQISGVVKNSVDQLIKLSLALSASTQQASAAAQQNAAIAQQVASGATQQSAQAEGISKALTQMSQAVAQMAATSREVSENTTRASKLAQQTGESTEKIGKMAEVVNTTAEQTNLLALNAAIEAARAGEAGRGFAVVADEVRKLADSSSKAAKDVQQVVKEISGSISNTVDGISTSSLKIDDVASGINQQAVAISQIAKTMDSIAAVAGQSAAGAQQLSASTQQTSAATQQIAAASTDLQRLADKLRKLVSNSSRSQNAATDSRTFSAPPTASHMATRLAAFAPRTPSVYHAAGPNEDTPAHEADATDSQAANNSGKTSEPS